MTRKAKDLSPDQKAVIENLLGRKVQEDEEITVRATPALSEQRRRELADQLRTHFAEVDARRKQGSEEDAEDIITEAMRSSRPNYHPHR
jgi:hypothetical protein